MINAKALNVLEFNKIKQDLSEYAISDLAKKYAMSLCLTTVLKELSMSN